MPKPYKNNMHNILCTACALAILGITPAYAIEHINRSIPSAKKVGEGRLSYLLWDVYDVTLYAPQGTWQQDKPFALKLSYLLDLEGRKIADRSVQEMREQDINNEIKLADWHAQMNKIFPDIKKGDSLTGVKADNGETIFYKNDLEIGRIKDPEFGKAFFGIWLNEKTSAPKLRRRLLGAL